MKMKELDKMKSTKMEITHYCVNPGSDHPVMLTVRGSEVLLLPPRREYIPKYDDNGIPVVECVCEEDRSGDNGKVYFAHPISCYQSEYAIGCKDKIRSILGSNIDILDPEFITEDNLLAFHDKFPSGNKFKHEMWSIFFPMIESCKYFAYAPDEHGTITSGVQYELAYANRINRDIINLTEE